jgi:uncharacterized BrkB/YihY/UPF0761 family membrane protein
MTFLLILGGVLAYNLAGAAASFLATRLFNLDQFGALVAWLLWPLAPVVAVYFAVVHFFHWADNDR